MAKLWVNGDRQDHVLATDRGLSYGDGLFATMRCNSRGVLFIDEHLARLEQGAKRLKMYWKPSADLRALLESIARQESNYFCGDFCVKLIVTRGCGGRGYRPPQQACCTEIISVHAIAKHYQSWQINGVSLQTSNTKLARQPLLAGMKHLNRLEQVLIKTSNLAEGYDDWLVLDTQDDVIESSMANIFLIKGEHVVTPSLCLSGVAGVMRQQLIYWFIDNGYHVDCRQVVYGELDRFDSAMLSNSLFGVIGVNRIDDRSFLPSSLVKMSRQAFELSL